MASQNSQSPASPRGMAGMASMSRPIIQSMPDNRQQSFEEIYGPPENFLEIEVRRCPRWSDQEHKEPREITYQMEEDEQQADSA